MLAPMTIDLVDGNDDWGVFLMSSGLVGTVCVILLAATRGRMASFSVKFGFLLVNLLWISTSLIAALPFFFSAQDMSFADALFEAVSGITTTGSTVLVGLDAMPRGLLLWRSMMQWFGGFGIIAMGLLLLPFLQIGGMQFFRMESSLQTENPMHRFASFSSALIGLYIALSVACVLAYFLGGMTLFDAINHAMTTISTGGYSTRDASLGGRPAHILWIAIVFMILGAMPFVAFLKAIVFRNLGRAFDPQIPALLGILAVLALVLAVWGYGSFVDQPFVALTHATFNVVSIVTTTGYASQDYTQWSSFAVGIFLLAMFLGGAAGSTSGGLKTYRLIIMFQLVSTSLKQLLMPHGVFPIVYNERQVDVRILTSIAVFLSAFFAVLMLLTVMLAATGLDLVTAFSGALTALTNVGPGLGNVIGPAGNFSSLSDTAKYLLSVGMIMGRLEIISVLVLLSPAFWHFGLGREWFAGFR